MKKPLPRAKHKQVALACVIFLSSMFSLAYASVPFYDWFCKVTGFGGTTQTAKVTPTQMLDRAIMVRFDSNIASDLPWRFHPKQNAIEVKLGELSSAVYEVENLSDKTSSGTATYNVSPPQSGGYFAKLECFCFSEQKLKPHEKREMVVRFFVDPELVSDKNVNALDSITLSYTFYPYRAGSQISRLDGQEKSIR